MNRQESERWDEASRRNRENAPEQATVAVTVHLLTSEYESVKRDAEWDGCSVAEYLRRLATGNGRRGC